MVFCTATATRGGAACMLLLASVLAWALWFPALGVAAQPTSCGITPGQWCPAPPGDPCGQHTDEAACRADRRCVGLPYRGESVVPCRSDGRGFSSNCPAVGCVSATGHSTGSKVEDALLPLWNQLPDRVGWQMLVSPAFPRNWPPAPPGRAAVVRYAFAMRLPPGVADGAQMAAPWARATLDANGGLVVEVLSPRLQSLGIQGVRPLRPGEGALVGQEQEVAERLLAGNGTATDRLVRDFTCNWISRQGVVAAAITPLHPAFARWLGCT